MAKTGIPRLREYFLENQKSPLESKLVLKLDWFILSFCCLAYFVNYLDRSNVSLAYVSGMQEDLGFHGAQLTVVNSVYSAGYLVGIIPNSLLLTHVQPRYFLPAMIVTWSVLCIGCGFCKTPQAMMAVRAFQGYFESCIFSGTHYLLGSWYTEEELGKRSGLFTSSGIAGGMFGGFLQAAIHSSMDGLQGLAGWRWMFVIDGIISLPVAIYGFLYFPNTPTTTTASYLSTEERELAVSRIPIVERTPILSKRFFKKAAISYYMWSFTVLWCIANCLEAPSSQSLMNLYMKALPGNNYTVSQLNNYPTGVQAVGIVSTLIWACWTDIYGYRWLSGYYNGITGICIAAIILSPGMSTGGVFAGYYWAGSIYCCQATLFAWANDTMRHESATLRAIVIGVMNFGGNAFQVFWPLIFYRANMAPMFREGMFALIGMSVAMIVCVTCMVLVERYIIRTPTVEVIDGLEGPQEDIVNGVLEVVPTDKLDRVKPPTRDPHTKDAHVLPPHM